MDNAFEVSTIQVKSYPASDLAPDEPAKILVRHVLLNHPATNLRGIADYYYASARYGANRGLFHIDRNFLTLPEVIDEQLCLKYVTCSNPSCKEDITELAPAGHHLPPLLAAHTQSLRQRRLPRQRPAPAPGRLGLQPSRQVLPHLRLVALPDPAL